MSSAILHRHGDDSLRPERDAKTERRARLVLNKTALPPVTVGGKPELLARKAQLTGLFHNKSVWLHGHFGQPRRGRRKYASFL